MRDTELRKARDRELYNVYIKGLRERHFETMREAVEWARMHPASRYYLSSKALVNYISIIENKKTSSRMFSCNENKIQTLYNCYLQYTATHPGCRLSKERICEILVEQPASSFFVCQDSAMKAILRERKKRLQELIENL